MFFNKKIIWIILLLVSNLHFCLLKKIWCNPGNDGGIEDGTTFENGFTRLWDAIDDMNSGDQVVVANGNWTNYPGMSIENSAHLPPSGTSYQSMSSIIAETDFEVYLPFLSDLGTGRSYILLQGFVFLTTCGLYGWDHSKLIRLSVKGAKAEGNTATFWLNSCSYMLLEECVAWGGGRYKFHDQSGHHNIWRRCVARHDWYISPSWAGQETNFRSYSSNNNTYQNCISIDSDREQYQTNASIEDADFWIGDQGGAGDNLVDGCISMKGMYQAYYLAGTDADPDESMILRNSVALGPYLEGLTGLTGAITYGVITLTVDNCLFYDIRKGNQKFVRRNKALGNMNMKNSIAKDTGPRDSVTETKMDYMCFFNVQDSGTTEMGVNSMELDPQNNGLLYPVRIEEGSFLKTSGENGEQIGPTILKKIGMSGKNRDEEGWDVVMTDEDLWPFPNEDKIKELLSVSVEGVDGKYGFCKDESQTLTKYIWEYLGNPIPKEIYNDRSKGEKNFGNFLSILLVLFVIIEFLFFVF